MPGRQSVQTGAPAAEYLPAAQSVHVAVPVTVLYFPPAHAEHTKPFAPVYPKSQRQTVIVVCPMRACPEFDGQSVHTAGPKVFLYFPAIHAVHTPFAPVYPKSQRQEPIAICPVSACPEFDGQSVHTAEPELTLYFPAEHNTQVAPSDPVAPALQVQSVMRSDA
jgi:hypothetical protein